jgi:hypothetical protein
MPEALPLEIAPVHALPVSLILILSRPRSVSKFLLSGDNLGPSPQRTFVLPAPNVEKGGGGEGILADEETMKGCLTARGPFGMTEGTDEERFFVAAK